MHQEVICFSVWVPLQGDDNILQRVIILRENSLSLACLSFRNSGIYLTDRYKSWSSPLKSSTQPRTQKTTMHAFQEVYTWVSLNMLTRKVQYAAKTLKYQINSSLLTHWESLIHKFSMSNSAFVFIVFWSTLIITKIKYIYFKNYDRTNFYNIQ